MVHDQRFSGAAMGNNKGFIISHTTFVSDLEFTKIMCTTSCFGALSLFFPIAILEGSNSRGGPTFSRDFGKVLVLRCKLYDFLQHGNVCKLCFTTTCANLSLFTNIDRGSPSNLGVELGCAQNKCCDTRTSKVHLQGT